MPEETKNTETSPEKGTGKEPHPVTPTEGSPEKTFRLKVNGSEQEYSQEKILEMAQRHAGGESKFEEAKKFREETLANMADFQDNAELGASLKKMYEEGDITQFKEIVQKVGGYSEEEADAVVKELQGNTTGGEGNTTGAPENTGMARLEALEAKIAERDSVIEDLQVRQQRDDQTHLVQYEKNLIAEVRSRVDKDEILGKLTSKVGKRSDGIHRAAWEGFQRRIAQAAARKETLGPQAFDEVVAEVRALVSDLDISQTGSTPGLLPTPMTLDEFHQGPPKKVSATDPDFKESIAAALKHKEMELRMAALG